MWLACYSTSAIAAAVDRDEDTVTAFVQKIRTMEGLPKSGKSAILHESDFSPQVYAAIFSVTFTGRLLGLPTPVILIPVQSATVCCGTPISVPTAAGQEAGGRGRKKTRWPVGHQDSRDRPETGCPLQG
jgi:hypothetical protein